MGKQNRGFLNLNFFKSSKAIKRQKKVMAKVIGRNKQMVKKGVIKSK